MILKSGKRFSEKIMLQRIEHDPEKREPHFRKDHASVKCPGRVLTRPGAIVL
jgi:hypothetical protein